jgi:hypothetical protein
MAAWLNSAQNLATVASNAGAWSLLSPGMGPHSPQPIASGASLRQARTNQIVRLVSIPREVGAGLRKWSV